jgi:tetratricopeptide (TPR) repeat protein
LHLWATLVSAMLEEQNFGSILKSLRTKKGKLWTQKLVIEELHERFRLDVSERAYKYWESGKHLPSPECLRALAAVLELNETDEALLYRAAAQTPPRIHNLPHRNRLFTGRVDALNQLTKFLEEHDSAAITQPVSISGLGGIGKTQLALEYAHKSYEDGKYRAVFWVNAADEASIQASYHSIGERIGLPEAPAGEQTVQSVKRWLEGHTQWLVEMDNADDLQLAQSYLPSGHKGRVVFTTRSQIVEKIARKVEVEAMGHDEAVLFLLRRSGVLAEGARLDTVGDTIRAEAAQLADMLGNYPLALDQAGAFIDEAQVSFEEYRELYEANRRRLLERRGTTGNDHPESVATTVAMSVDKATERYPLARDILLFCSFLQPDDIPEELLEFDSVLALDAMALNEAIAALRRYSLLRRNPTEKTLSMHRMVQTVVEDSLPLEAVQQWRTRIVRAFSAAESVATCELFLWKYGDVLAAHVRRWVEWDDVEADCAEDASRLLLEAGSHPYTLIADKSPFFTKALVWSDRHLGAEHPISIVSAHYVACQYYGDRLYDRAIPLYERVLAAYQAWWGDEDERVQACLPQLAMAYMFQGSYDRALSLYRQFVGHLEAQASNSPEFIAALEQLAWAYEATPGKLSKAAATYDRLIRHLETQNGVTIELLPHLRKLITIRIILDEYEQMDDLFLKLLAIFDAADDQQKHQMVKDISLIVDAYDGNGYTEEADALYEQLQAIGADMVDPNDSYVVSAEHIQRAALIRLSFKSHTLQAMPSLSALPYQPTTYHAREATLAAMRERLSRRSAYTRPD